MHRAPAVSPRGLVCYCDILNLHRNKGKKKKEQRQFTNVEVGVSERCHDSERTRQLVSGRAWCKGRNTRERNWGTGRGCQRGASSRKRDASPQRHNWRDPGREITKYRSELKTTFQGLISDQVKRIMENHFKCALRQPKEIHHSCTFSFDKFC